MSRADEYRARAHGEYRAAYVEGTADIATAMQRAQYYATMAVAESLAELQPLLEHPVLLVNGNDQ